MVSDGEIREAYARVFAGDDGQLVLNDLLDHSQVYNRVFVPDAPAQTGYNDGRRSVGLHVLDRLGLIPRPKQKNQTKETRR